MKPILLAGVTDYPDRCAVQDFIAQDHFIPALTHFPEMLDELSKGGRDNDRKNCRQYHK